MNLPRTSEPRMPRQSPKRVRLTKRTVDALKWGATMYDVYDDALKGFHVQVWPSGTKVFAIRYRDPASQGDKARYFRFKLGEYPALSVEEAREAAERARGMVNKGESPSTERRTRRASADVGGKVSAYLEHMRQDGCAARTIAETERLLTLHAAPLYHLKVADVTREHVARVLGPVRAKTPTQANRVRSAVSGFFTWADAEGLRPDHTNPARGTIKAAETKRGRALKPAERTTLATVLAQADDVPWQAVGIVWLIAATGMRREEAVQLRWDAIETNDDGTEANSGCFHLRSTKTGDSIRPVRGAAVRARLEEFKEHARRMAKASKQTGYKKSPYVFPSPVRPTTWYKSLNDHWPTLRERAGLDNAPALRLHDLRHDFASALGESLGDSLVNYACGWKGTSMASRYQHASADMLAELSDKIDVVRAPQLVPKADPTTVVSITEARRSA